MDNINDTREQKKFTGITFSKYKKSDAKKQLLTDLLDGKIEGGNYWAGEFICAGHFLDLWDIILLFLGKNIHLANPKLPIYLNIRFNDFKNIIQNGYHKNELEMRNNANIRELFAEIITILSLSNKKYDLTPIKISKDAFDISVISDKLLADSTDYARIIYKKEDPKDIFIAVNEFVYNLINTKNTRDCCYWLEWLLAFETEYKHKKKVPLICYSRTFVDIHENYKKDFIWIIWDIILRRSTFLKNDIEKVVKNLLDLFIIKYNPSCKKKRKFIIYNAILLLTENININTPVYKDNSKIKLIKNKINLIYREIKKNEIVPRDNYLFNNSINQTSNIDKTMKKLTTMNTTNIIIRTNELK
jgi:hypothetical protein